MRTGKVSKGPGSDASLFAVSRDGRQFASYEYAGNGTISLWTVGGSKPTVRSPDPTPANSDSLFYFSQDGVLLAVGSAVTRCTDTSLFDTRTLQLSFHIPMEGCFAAFSEDGKYVVSRWLPAGAGFPEPTRHPITLDGVLAETCAKVLTNLTAREWEKMGATALAVATCPERAASLQGEAALGK